MTSGEGGGFVVSMDPSSVVFLGAISRFGVPKLSFTFGPVSDTEIHSTVAQEVHLVYNSSVRSWSDNRRRAPACSVSQFSREKQYGSSFFMNVGE